MLRLPAAIIVFLSLVFLPAVEGQTTKKQGTPRPSRAATPKPAADATPSPERAPNVSIEPDTLVEFASQPARVQNLIRTALALTRQGLTYKYGSADPAQGGMDCSGTIYYLLRAAGFTDVPRDSSGQYAWTRRAGGFRAVIGKNANSFEFDELLPGDLMFWTGTYEVARDIPISHVMLYLGTEKKTRQRVMFGASDGRSYRGIRRSGVSVFDFKMPKSDPDTPARSRADFVGYARIPALRDSTPAMAPAATPDQKPKNTPSAKGTPASKK